MKWCVAVGLYIQLSLAILWTNTLNLFTLILEASALQLMLGADAQLLGISLNIRSCQVSNFELWKRIWHYYLTLIFFQSILSLKNALQDFEGDLCDFKPIFCFIKQQLFMIHRTLVFLQCLHKWLKGQYPTDSHSLTFIVPKRPKCCFLLT